MGATTVTVECEDPGAESCKQAPLEPENFKWKNRSSCIGKEELTLIREAGGQEGSEERTFTILLDPPISGRRGWFDSLSLERVELWRGAGALDY